MSERVPEIPKDICPHCLHNRSEHSEDCTYEEQLKDAKKAELITPEYEDGVGSGKITYINQIKDVNKILGMIMDPEDIKMSEILDRAAKENDEELKYGKQINTIKTKVEYCEKVLKELNKFNIQTSNNQELAEHLESIISKSLKLKDSYYKVLVSNSDDLNFIQETDLQSDELKELIDNFTNKFKA